MTIFLRIANKINRLWLRRYQIQKYKLKFLGARIGKNNTFNDWITVVGNYSNLTIGDQNIFNQHIVLNVSSEIFIGNRNHFSAGVKIITTKLNENLTRHFSFPVQIGDNNWFATDSLIAVSRNKILVPGGIILGAKSLLNDSASIPGLYVGVPANIHISREK